MSIFDVCHQDRAHRTLQRALASKRMPHAYLFVGPEGVGRELLASRLAQTLLCEKPIRRPAPAELQPALDEGGGLDACGECKSCHMVRGDTHPDLSIIHRQLVRQHPDSTVRKQKALTLGVEVIRHFVVDRVGFKPYQGKAKVFIIREAERLNDSAQNSLLKTLEEPPGDTFLILLVTSLDRLLPTIRSRCQPVYFGALPDDYISRQLKTLRPGAAAEEIGYLATHSAGSLGRALQQVDEGIYALTQEWRSRLESLSRPPRGFAPHSLAGELLADARKLAESFAEREPDASDTDALRGGLQMLLAILSDLYRDALRSGITTAPAEQTAPLQRAIRLIAETEENLGRNAHPELTLEALFIRLSHTAA